MSESIPGPGSHLLTNGTFVRIISSDQYIRVKAVEMRRDLLVAAMSEIYEGKTLCDVFCEPDHEIVGRKIPIDGHPVSGRFVYDVADTLKAFNPHLFTTNYGFRRALMGENQRDFFKCQELHKYTSLEYRHLDMQHNTYRPMLSAIDLLAFFSSPFFTGHTTNKLLIFEEDKVNFVKRDNADANLQQSAAKFASGGASSLIYSALDTFNSSSKLLEEVRTLKRPAMSVASNAASKTQRIQHIVSEVEANTLRVVVDANVLLFKSVQSSES